MMAAHHYDTLPGFGGIGIGWPSNHKGDTIPDTFTDMHLDDVNEDNEQLKGRRPSSVGWWMQLVIVLDFSRYCIFPLQLNSTGFHLTGSTIDYYNRRPDVFSNFAEYNEPANDTAVEIDDTGSTIRVLLPTCSPRPRGNELERYLAI